MPLPDRLAELAAEFVALFEEYRPDALALERVLFQVNVRTAMSVGQVSGLCMAEAARRAVPVSEYSPNQVKDAVVGYGAATKDQVQMMVQTILGLSSPPRPPDAADAAAVALCHLAMSPSGAHHGAQRMIGSLRGWCSSATSTERSCWRSAGSATSSPCRRGCSPNSNPGRRCSSTSTTTSARTPRRCSGSRHASERQTFQVLIKTNGIGPALAMAILATHPPAALFDVVSNNDVAALTLVPGVGKKTAERLIVGPRRTVSGPGPSSPLDEDVHGTTRLGGQVLRNLRTSRPARATVRLR